MQKLRVNVRSHIEYAICGVSVNENDNENLVILHRKKKAGEHRCAPAPDFVATAAGRGSLKESRSNRIAALGGSVRGQLRGQRISATATASLRADA
jgi:hypothetical protein